MKRRGKRLAVKLSKRVVSVLLLACFFVGILSGINTQKIYAQEIIRDDEKDDSGNDYFNDKEKVVRVGYYKDNDAFQSGCSDELRKTGYAYEFYQDVSKYTGWRYEYVYGNFDEIYNKLLKGEVDIMAGITKTQERVEQLLFPEYPMGEETYFLFVASQREEEISNDVKKLDGSVIGIKTNSFMEEMVKNFAEKNNIQVTIKEYDSLEERVKKLESGELDALVTVEHDRTGMEGVKPVYNIDTSDFYFAINRERDDLLQELNDAQEEIFSNFPSYIYGLQDKYFNTDRVQKSLTDQEKEWILAHPNLKVGYLAEYMPFCDRDDIKDTPRGMLTEIIDILSSYMGSEFTTICYDDYTEMIEALENGKIDCVFPTYEESWYSENLHYTQTSSVVSTRMCVVYKGDYRDEIYNRIAISMGSPLQPFYLKIYFPEAEQIAYRNWDECLNAIRTGEVGSMLINSALIYRYFNDNNDYSDLQISELEDTVQFCFAVRRGDSVLYSILNKGLSTIEEETINDMLIRSSYIEPSYTLKVFLVNHLGIVFTLIILFICTLVLFFVLYQRRVSRDRSILQESFDREKAYIADREENFSIIGSLGRIYSSAYHIDLMSHTFQTIVGMNVKKDSVQDIEHEKDIIERWIKTNIVEGDQESLAEFLNIETLSERMKSAESISMEYETLRMGFCRGNFISVKRGSRGELLFVIYAVQEINEEKKRQQQAQMAMKDAYEAANRANHAKSDFLARMSHDIRTPMNAIMGMTTIATAHIDEKERVLDCLEKIMTSGKHLLTLINEVLDMSKIESGRLELTEEKIQLTELIERMKIMMQPQVDAKNQHLEIVELNVKHENVIGDNLHIQQVFVNLMGNAVKYTPPGGTIKMSVSEKEVNKPRIGCFEFVFEDNGIGMSKEFLDHIFEPFSRENERSDNKEQGSGLGLAIVHNIIKMMGGNIKVESEKGKGSRFTVTLFLRIADKDKKDAITVNQDPLSELKQGEFSGKRILLVEDNEINAEIAVEILNMEGLVVDHAWNGREALECLMKSQAGYYDLIFMDIQMPEMNGYDTARAIRATDREDLHKIPIIAMTANAFSEDVRAAMQAGMNQHIAKPLDIGQLRTVLHKWIEK